MPVLNIRSLPDEVHRRLRIRAAQSGRSMEAEARAILANACFDQEAPMQALASARKMINDFYGDQKPTGVVDELLAERSREAARE